MIIILILAVVYCTADLSLGFSQSSPLWTLFTYPLQHMSLAHLILNSICFLPIHRRLRWEFQSSLHLPICFVVAVLAATACKTIYTLPVVGISGVNYCMLGYFTVLACRGRLPFYREGLHLQQFLVCLAISFTISYFRTNSAFLLHLICYLAGLVICYLKTLNP